MKYRASLFEPKRPRECKKEPRSTENIERDVEALELPFHRNLADHVRNQNNWEQTLRLMKHLLTEQVLLTPSSQAIASVFSWLVKDWHYLPATELYRGFVIEMHRAVTVCPSRGDLVHGRIKEFQSIVIPMLKEKVNSVMGMEGPREPPTKRKYSNLPAIPEEAESLKQSASIDELSTVETPLQMNM
jgi:hypothetical protein